MVRGPATLGLGAAVWPGGEMLRRGCGGRGEALSDSGVLVQSLMSLYGQPPRPGVEIVSGLLT